MTYPQKKIVLFCLGLLAMAFFLLNDPVICNAGIVYEQNFEGEESQEYTNYDHGYVEILQPAGVFEIESYGFWVRNTQSHDQDIDIVLAGGFHSGEYINILDQCYGATLSANNASIVTCYPETPVIIEEITAYNLTLGASTTGNYKLLYGNDKYLNIESWVNNSLSTTTEYNFFIEGSFQPYLQPNGNIDATNTLSNIMTPAYTDALHFQKFLYANLFPISISIVIITGFAYALYAFIIGWLE